jgi:hypothetical protein
MQDIITPLGDIAAPTKPSSGSSLDGKLFLVGLGAQKAGSTWMARYLRSHPDVYVPPLKEIHYFDAVYLRRLNGHITKRFVRMAEKIANEMAIDSARVSHKDKEKYRALTDRIKMTRENDYPYMKFFEDRVTDEGVFCDITPAYSMLSSDGYEAILNMHPNIRWVFILRDPVDRYWSALRMGVRKRKNADPYGEFMTLLDREDYYLRTDYKRTILELERLVPPDRIKYVFYESLFTPQSVDELTSFIGVKPWPANFEQVVNPGEKMPIDPQHLNAALKKYRHVYEFVFERFGDLTPARWRTSSASLFSGA